MRSYAGLCAHESESTQLATGYSVSQNSWLEEFHGFQPAHMVRLSLQKSNIICLVVLCDEVSGKLCFHVIQQPVCSYAGFKFGDLLRNLSS